MLYAYVDVHGRVCVCVCVKLIVYKIEIYGGGNSLELVLVGEIDSPVYGGYDEHVCMHVWICLVCPDQCVCPWTLWALSSIPLWCRFWVPVLPPSSRQPARLLKHNMYTWVTSVGALGWSMGRGATLSRNNMLQTKTASRVLFSFSILPKVVIFGEKEIEYLILQEWQTTFREIIIPMVWGKGVYKRKKWNPSRKEMWYLSHYYATLVYCFAVACISETVFFCFLRECIKTELFCTPPKKILNRSKQSFITGAI